MHFFEAYVNKTSFFDKLDKKLLTDGQRDFLGSYRMQKQILVVFFVQIYLFVQLKYPQI